MDRLAAFGMISLYLLTMVYKGVAFQWLWGWFVAVPFGVMPLTMGHAMGLSLLVSYLTFTYAPDERSFRERLIASILLPCIALALGKIYLWLM